MCRWVEASRWPSAGCSRRPGNSSNVYLNGATWGEAGPQRARQGLRERAIAIQLLSLRSRIGPSSPSSRLAFSDWAAFFASARQRVMGEDLPVSRRSGRRRPAQGSGVDLAVSRRSGRRRLPQDSGRRESSQVSRRSGGVHHPQAAGFQQQRDCSPSRLCQVEPESSRSVEVCGVDDVDQCFVVDQTAQILGE